MSEPLKILVIKLGALGDFIQALGPMAAIRQHHPDAHITLLTTAPFETFGRDCGYFNEILIDHKPRWLDLKGWVGLQTRLNRGGFERVYDLQNNDRSRFYFRLFMSGHRPEWVGTARGASHRNTSPERTAGHALDGHVQTLALAGIKDVQVDKMEWLDAPITIFSLKKPYVLLVPGSSPTRPEKRWPAEHYTRLALLLSGLGYQPVILGTAAEREIALSITRQCMDALDLTGQTSLGEIAAMARKAAGAIGNDTGPIHLIAATGCHSLVLFSRGGNPKKHTPKGANVRILQTDNLATLSPEKVLKNFRPREIAGKQKSATIH